MANRMRKPLILGGTLVVTTGFAFWARRSLGIEFDPRSLRDYVLDLGPIAPVVMVLLVALRSVIGIPSQLVLIASGLCFGIVRGTLYGTLGLVTSGLLTFLLARYAGSEYVERQVPARLRPMLDQAGDRLGAIFVAFATGYPIGIITAYHAIAGITAMRLGVFLVAVTLGSIVRAGTYAVFGNSMLEEGYAPLLQATALLGAAFGLPLLIPRVREIVLRVLMPHHPAAADTENDATEGSDAISSPAHARDSTQNPP